MFPSRWFLPYDAIFQLITSAVALAIALYALKGHRWIKERTLYALFLAFMLLSVGMFINGITLSYAYLFDISFTQGSGALSMADLGFWAYYVTSVVAYAILVFAYTRRLRDSSVALAAGGMGRGGGGAAGSSLVLAGPLLELVLSVLLFIILVSQLAHLVVKRSKYSILVTVSFLLLLASHILIMFSPLEDIVYVIGRVLELAGFLALLGLLYGLRGKQ